MREAHFVLFCQFNSPSPVSNIGGRYMNCMRQPVRIYGNVPLNARYFLASVIALLTRRVGVLDALRVNDAKTRVRRTTMAVADLAN